MASATLPRDVPARGGLYLHAALALLGLWSFYTLMLWTSLNALPQSATEERGVSATFVLASMLSLLMVAASGPISVWLLDRLLKIEWIPLEEAGDVGPHLRDILSARRLPIPRLGVIREQDAGILTYGVSRGSARLLVTTGLLEGLDLEKQCALVAHEAGHLVSGDFCAATLFAGPILVLTQLRGLFDTQGVRFGATATAPGAWGAGASGGFLTPLLAVLTRIYSFFYAGFAQARERWADGFSAHCDGSQPLREGLLDMLMRLVSVPPSVTTPSLQPQRAFATAARGFSPLDATAAGRLGTAAAWQGALNREGLAGMARAVEADAASFLPHQSALHPPLAARISSVVGPPRACNARAAIFALLPLLGFLLGLAISIWRGGWFGLPLILWGGGRVLWLYNRHGRLGGRVADAAALRVTLQQLSSPTGAALATSAALRTCISGRLVGYGIPGVTWCPDLVMEVEGTFIALRPRVGWALWRPGAQGVLRTAIDEDCRAHGILRMSDVPVLELHALDVHGRRLWNSYFVASHLLGSTALVLLGLLIMVPQWLGV